MPRSRPRANRRHGLGGVRPLAETPLDGGGIEAVEHLEVVAPLVEGARIVTLRPRLEGGTLPRQPSLVLATRLEHRPLAPGLAVRPVAFEWDGTTIRAQV